MRKVFLEELPTKEGIGALKGKLVIDWMSCINKRVKFTYDDIEGEVEIVDHIKGYLYLKYKNKDIFKIHTGGFQKCKLGILLSKITSEFKVEIGQTFKDDKRDITIIDRKYEKDKSGNNRRLYKYKCNKCGFECGGHYKNGEYKEEFWILESDLLKGQGCSCCGYNSKIVVEHINSIVANPETHWMIKYFQGGYDEAKLYTRTSNQKIYPVCPYCEKIKGREMIINTIYYKKAIACSCGDGQSYPNKFMFNMLEQLGINFETEYSPEWVGRKKYDFYIPSKNLIIEMDGGLGHGKKSHSKSNKTIEETKADDDYKDMMAEQNNIEVIRINCDESELEYIKNNILNSKLSELLGLSTIDWLKCEEFSLSNRCKEACEHKKNNPEMTTFEIGKIMNLGHNAIRMYLKKGSELGWCNYDPVEEKFKGSRKAGKSNGKPVELFKDGISLGIFESVAELERQSENLLGIRLITQAISIVALGKIKKYKGFKFKYV